MGLSHAMDRKASKEDFVLEVAKNWMQIATKEQSPTSSSLMKHSQLYDLCTNRQQPVRRLLEIISKAQDGEPDTGEQHEVIYTYTHTYIYPYTLTYTYINIYIHTYIHTYTHTHIHTYTHINRLPCQKGSSHGSSYRR